MKSIDNQLRTLKNQFGDKISLHLKNKIDRYNFLFKQMLRNPYFKGLQDDQNQKILVSIKKEIMTIKKEIESQIKMDMSDYDAFVWKNEKVLHTQGPQLFQKLSDIRHKKIKSVRQTIRTDFNFPILSCKNQEMIRISSELIQTNYFVQDNFDSETISNLVYRISSGYRIVSYHNFSHAFSVFLMLFQCRQNSPKLNKMYSPFEFFIAYIAALSHDINHSGFNSNWQIKNKTDLAAKYNNESVLEIMHISELHRIFREFPEVDILSKIKNAGQRQSAKRIINKLILATDVTFHWQHLNKLVDLTPKSSNLDKLQSDQKQAIFENIFHGCDIGNPCLDFDNYIDWSILLAHQFNTQACLQKQANFQISPNFEYIDMATHFKRQIGFIDFLAYPLWKQIVICFPELKHLLTSMENNKQTLRIKLSQQINKDNN